MLLEPGPLRLFTDAEIPRALVPTDFEGPAVQEAREHTAGAGVLESAIGRFAPGVGAPSDLAAASDLRAADDAHDRQSREIDSAIGGISSGAGVLEGDLAGLTNELASELANAAVPIAPEVPDDSANEDWKDPEYVAIVTEWFNKYLGHNPPDGYAEELRDAHARLVDVLTGILTSEEYLARIGGGGDDDDDDGGGGDTYRGHPLVDGYIESTQAEVEAYMDAHPDRRGTIEQFIADNEGDWHRVGRVFEWSDWNDFIADLRE